MEVSKIFNFSIFELFKFLYFFIFFLLWRESQDIDYEVWNKPKAKSSDW